MTRRYRSRSHHYSAGHQRQIASHPFIATPRSLGTHLAAKVLQRAAVGDEPFFLTDYLLPLAERFNAYYHNHRILIDDPRVRGARLRLVTAVQTVLQDRPSILRWKERDFPCAFSPSAYNRPSTQARKEAP